MALTTSDVMDCERCDARIATINNDDKLLKRTAEHWCKMNNTDEIKPEHINYMGCRAEVIKTYFCTFMYKVRKCCIEK